ncbi:acyltransferase domain-containing protein [Pedobacter sp. NJ-S-72]
MGNKKVRAGVSSFGVGGTNVHVIVEEYDHLEAVNQDNGRLKNLFSWSAKSEESLHAYGLALKTQLHAQPDLNLADIAYTLQTTRADFLHRNFIVAGTKDELLLALTDSIVPSAKLKRLPGETVFLFPGQGAQYIKMGAELYANEPVYQSAVDECAVILNAYLDKDIRTIIYAGPDDSQAGTNLNHTKYTQPALFVTSYALATLWMSWGIQPSILCGHSIGEYVAAHLAGIFTLEDGLKLIASRGAMVSGLPSGSMLSVRASALEIEKILPETLSMAAINSPKLCVVAGEDEDINAFQLQLDEKLILHKRLKTSHAFHSSMMDPILKDFSEVVSQVKLTGHKNPLFLRSPASF